MAEERIQRKLAAILAADVVGYSRLMRADEEGTLRRFKTLRAEVIDPEIAAHSGRIFKLMGDGMLVEFGSVVDAVRAAAHLQRAMAERNTDAPDDTRIAFRVGINLGDVVIDGDDIYGDGVNVAARLEGIAEPGGICISGSVYEQVRDRIDLVFQDTGAREVKNIDRPIATYAWHPNAREPAITAAPATHKSSRKPTVAVPAFETVGRSEDAELLAAGATNAVATALSNQTGLSLVSDPEKADYLVKCSIQAAENRYRATARLLDRRSGEQFASDRFDGDLSDVFEAQDELAYRVYTSLRFAIPLHEKARGGDPTDAEAPTDALLTEAATMLLFPRRANWEQARVLAERALVREPDNFMAFAIKAMGHLVEAICGYKEISPHDGNAALAAAQKAVQLNEHSDFAHLMKANVHFFYERDIAATKREAERTLELNPYYPMGLFVLGHALIFDGETEKGVSLCKKAVEANPRMPMNHAIMHVIAIGQFVLNDYAGAVEWAQRSDQQAGDVTSTLLTLATAASNAGQRELATATATAERILAIHPDIKLGTLRRYPFRKAEDWDRFVDGLREAGIPD